LIKGVCGRRATCNRKIAVRGWLACPMSPALLFDDFLSTAIATLSFQINDLDLTDR
jgi:hypothetical protein